LPSIRVHQSIAWCANLVYVDVSLRSRHARRQRSFFPVRAHFQCVVSFVVLFVFSAFYFKNCLYSQTRISHRSFPSSSICFFCLVTVHLLTYSCIAVLSPPLSLDYIASNNIRVPIMSLPVTSTIKLESQSPSLPKNKTGVSSNANFEPVDMYLYLLNLSHRHIRRQNIA
jgi:hypothetical protein